MVLYKKLSGELGFFSGRFFRVKLRIYEGNNARKFAILREIKRVSILLRYAGVTLN